MAILVTIVGSSEIVFLVTKFILTPGEFRVKYKDDKINEIHCISIFFLSYAGMILMLESNWGIDSRLVIFKSHV